MNGSDLADFAFNEANITYDMSGEEGVIDTWNANENWSWDLYYWDNNNESWSNNISQDLDEIQVSVGTHLAWVASNANLTNLPPGVDCNGNGWIMGSGSSAHCMCDEGFERSDGNWLGCSLIGTENTNSSEVNPHDASLGEYGVGHSTVTFILDKQTRKRVAWTGINWDVQEFLLDIQALSSE